MTLKKGGYGQSGEIVKVEDFSRVRTLYVVQFASSNKKGFVASTI